ncbi:hypothetical protein Micbo1qcDRAFT_207947 [Microdochium bolleyi]|uniref:Uncharacterized protein n=1 Tax=Microdochium bolleyi TaxID=196109 RepID=A0A136IS96_9PEZI|nr:hypothetical protein Micbo1qcDRAFT_207947 [Microdochium bolleyi]
MDEESTRRASAQALEDMMNDLGLSRAEEVALDDSRYSARPPPRPSTQPQVQDTTETANMWKNAVREGLFHDSDYESVKLLDPISGGNLHRENRLRDAITLLVQGDSRYDPTQPGYGGGKRKRHTARDIEVDPTFKVSALGVLLPPGMTTKRWESGTKTTPEAFERALQHAKEGSWVPTDSFTAATDVSSQTPEQPAPSNTVGTVQEDMSSLADADQCDQVSAVQDIMDALLGISEIEAVVVHANINTPHAQCCLALVSTVTEDTYAELTQTSRNLAIMLHGIALPAGTDRRKSAALQASLLHLMRLEAFKALPMKEKKRALAIVYRRVL